MKEFNVEVKEVLYYSFTVEAESEEEAIEIAGNEYWELDTYPEHEVEKIYTDEVEHEEI